LLGNRLGMLRNRSCLKAEIREFPFFYSVLLCMRTDRNLDILRAVAVLTVLVAHCLPASTAQQAAGRYAVLIFFVHTALVLLLSLERQMTASRPYALSFYVQRVFRIYPLSILCVLVTLAFRISWPDPVFSPHSGVSIAANLLLVQNALGEHSSISPPLWSLPYEVQMYAVLPAVFWFLRGRRASRAVILVLVSLAMPVTEALTRPFAAFVATRFVPCFTGGALAYCGYHAGRRLAWWLLPAVVLGLGLLYWGTGHSAPGEWFACMTLGILLPAFREVPRNLLSKAAGYVARYSYGIYLSHAPLLWLCFQRLTVRPWARWVLFCSLIFVVPVALYHMIEEPMIGAGKAISTRICFHSASLLNRVLTPDRTVHGSAG
jgi:peptidoglycan/LPS O-acetylase OafA/YrhL